MLLLSMITCVVTTQAAWDVYHPRAEAFFKNKIAAGVRDIVHNANPVIYDTAWRQALVQQMLPVFHNSRKTMQNFWDESVSNMWFYNQVHIQSAAPWLCKWCNGINTSDVLTCQNPNEFGLTTCFMPRGTSPLAKNNDSPVLTKLMEKIKIAKESSDSSEDSSTLPLDGLKPEDMYSPQENGWISKFDRENSNKFIVTEAEKSKRYVWYLENFGVIDSTDANNRTLEDLFQLHLNGGSVSKESIDRIFQHVVGFTDHKFLVKKSVFGWAGEISCTNDYCLGRNDMKVAVACNFVDRGFSNKQRVQETLDYNIFRKNHRIFGEYEIKDFKETMRLYRCPLNRNVTPQEYLWAKLNNNQL